MILYLRTEFSKSSTSTLFNSSYMHFARSTQSIQSSIHVYMAKGVTANPGCNPIRPFYISEIIQFGSGFTLDQTRFSPSTLKPVPIELVSNQFESVHFVFDWMEMDCQSLRVDSHGLITTTKSVLHVVC